MKTQKIINNSSCVQDWVNFLPWVQQSILFSAIRSCDSIRDHYVKIVTRLITTAILKQTWGKDSKIEHYTISGSLYKIQSDFIESLDTYPTHFVKHILQAVEILSYKYPVIEDQKLWYDLYEKMCDELSIPIETQQNMEKRLN